MKGEISPSEFILSACIGCLLTLSMIVPMLTGKLRNIR